MDGSFQISGGQPASAPRADAAFRRRVDSFLDTALTEELRAAAEAARSMTATKGKPRSR